jgi:SAM-dependent methyltransferase
MPDWQERITYETAPAIRVEHELRYRSAAPLILRGGPWADLGCGNGLAAAAALGEARPQHAVLVDVEQELVAGAALELALPHVVQLAGDLTDRETLEQVGGELIGLGGEPVVTCFEVVEHLSTFLALLQWSAELAREHAATFVISVPNDAFWAIQNPFHQSSWGEGAFEELCQLLPPEHTLLRQVALGGSALLAWDEAPARHELALQVGGEGTVASHFIVAFGLHHHELWRGALASQTDELEQRYWERQRETELAFAQALADKHGDVVVTQSETIARQAEELRSQTRQFDEWRAYIHELEHELGRPLSGVQPDEQANQAQPSTEAQAATDSGDPAKPPA